MSTLPPLQEITYHDLFHNPDVTVRFSASRHPYTYAADFLRDAAADQFAPIAKQTLPSRTQASSIRQAIAEVLGMSDEVLAEKLSEAYQRKFNVRRDGA